MTPPTERRRRLSRSVASLVLGAVLATLAAGPSAAVVGAEPTGATGWIRVSDGYFVVDRSDQTIKGCGPASFDVMDAFVIRVRMERRGTTWVDAGSTFRAEAAGIGPPCSATIGPGNLDCWEYDEQSLFGAEGRIMGRPPLPALIAGASIRLSVDPVAGTASFGATLIGNGPGGGDSNGIEYEEANGYGGSCPNGYPPSVSKVDLPGAGGGWRVGRFVQVPSCPGAANGVTGTLDATRTHITFSCSRDDHGKTPNGDGTYEQTTQVHGVITLSP